MAGNMEGVTPWPRELAESYRRAGYWRGQTFGDVVADWASAHGDAPALVGGGQRLSYREMAARADGCAEKLLDLGIKPGDRVVIQLPNIVEFVILTLALFRIGGLPVMALPAHRRHEISYFAEFSGAVAYAIPSAWGGFDYQDLARQVKADSRALKHVLVVGEGIDPAFTDLTALCAEPGGDATRLDALRPDPASVALFLLSGGTTGLPKLIPRSHDDYIYNFEASAQVSGFGPDTVYLAALPVSHNFPLSSPGLLGAFHGGGRVVLAPTPKAEAAIALMRQESVTVSGVVPAIAIQWMDYVEREGTGVASLEMLQVGGAKLNPEAARRIGPVLGCKLQQVFGMAEGLLCYTRPDDAQDIVLNTQGRPLSPGDEIRIVGPDGAPVAPGQPGELLTRGPYTLRGYYKAEEHNRRAFTPDGFYRTGDVVRADAAGNLTVEGREKDLINRGGEKISAEEIENLILGHPAVFNTAAVAMADPTLGERVCAYVQLKEGHSLDLAGLVAHLEAQDIAKFKLPERLVLIDALPVTNVGKVDKKALREDIAARLEAESG